MAISRMQEPRQLYGLGSLVKSIGKTVKKVVKSDLGKAALLAAVGFGIPGTQFGGLLGRASFGGAAPSIFGKTGGISALLSGGTKFLPGSTAAMKGAAVTTPGIFGSIPGGGYTVGAIGSILAASGMSPEEIEETKRDPEKVKIYLRDYYSKTNPDASSEEVEEFVNTNTSEYAVGGRVGLEKGGSAFEEYKQDLEDGIISPDTTFNEWLDNNAPDPDYDKSYAVGGRVSFADGKNMKMASMDENEKELMRLVEEFMERGFSQQEAIEEAKDTLERKSIAIGGRVGLESGTPKKGLESLTKEDLKKFRITLPNKFEYDEDGNRIEREIPRTKGPYKYDPDKDIKRLLLRNKSAMGGLQSMPMGQMRRNQAGTIERDYRETGGFVPVGIKEKADDVPAMLSKNEFVMTADAVRGIGDGNIEKGAQRLYDQMKTAEKRVV
jgi:hypothetical protein